MVKQKQNKVVSMVLTCTVALSMFATYAPQNVNAQTDGTQGDIQIKKMNQSIPENIVQLAQSSFMTQATLLDKAQNKGDVHNYNLGEGFMIYKFNGESDGNFYFPVLENDEVKYIATVGPKTEADIGRKNGEYTVRVNAFISDALNEQRATDESFAILSDENGYYIEKDKKLELIKRSNDPKKIVSDEKLSQEKREETKEIDAKLTKETTATKEITKTDNTRFYASEIQYNKLGSFQIRETQGQNSWCAGYTMAALLNATKNTSQYNAHDVMRAIHPNLSEQQLVNTGTTTPQMISYGQSQGRQIQDMGGKASYDQVDQYTKENKGIAIAAESLSPSESGIHTWHAMALVGTASRDNGERYIMYWNPWDRDISSQSPDSDTLTLSGGVQYVWRVSLGGY